MNDNAKKKEEGYRRSALANLVAFGLPPALAAITFEQLKAYRGFVAEHTDSPADINPLELVDVELLTNAWAFSTEGVNFYRIALETADPVGDYLPVGGFTISPTGKPVAEHVTEFVNSKFGGWLASRNIDYGMHADTFSPLLAGAAYTVTYLTMQSEQTDVYVRMDGAYTFVFKTNNPELPPLVVLDFYNDFWERQP